MPEASPGAYPRLIYTRFKPKFEEVDFTTPLNGPFDMNVPLQALQAEAEAKDCVVIIQTALVPAADFYGPPTEEAPNEPGSGSTPDAG